MERRGEPRIRKRTSCELTVGERRFSGVVLDVSRHGLFVQTAAQPGPQEVVHVSISAPGLPDPLELDAVVARARIVPAQLRTVAKGGLGLHIAEPSEAFQRFVENIAIPTKIEKVSVLPGAAKPRERRLTREHLDRYFSTRLRPRPAAPQPPAPARAPGARGAGPPDPPSWRIELRHIGSGSHRSMLVRGASEDEVRQHVADELEECWKIERIERA